MSHLLAPFLTLLLSIAALAAPSAQQARLTRTMLAGRSLLGKWKLSDDSNFRLNSLTTMVNQQTERIKRSSSLFNFLQTSAIIREVEGFFESGSYEDEQASTLYLKLIDGRFADNSSVVMEISMGSQLESRPVGGEGLTLWSSSHKEFVTCLLVRGQNIIGKFSVNAQIELSLQVSQGLDDRSRFLVNFASGSFSFYADLKPVTDEYNSLVQTVVACSILFALAVFFLKPKKTVYNLSEWMIVQVAAFVVAANYILLNEAFARMDTSLKWVAVCAVLNVASTLFLLRNYEDVVFNEFNNLKKTLYLVAYLVIYFSLVGFFSENLVFWIYEAFWLLAVQISYSYWMGGRGGMAIKLVLTIVVTRIPFVYYRFYFEELTREPNNPNMLLSFIGICIIMLAFITLQRYFGSRFLIPKELIPDYFNYFQRQSDPELLKEACPICTLPLGEEDSLKGNQSGSLDAGGKRNGDKVELISVQTQRSRLVLMVTPCEHRFHQSCLMDWMDKRLNCPMCRASLPPSEQQRDDSYCC